jgi:hypothetical protein
MSILSSMEALAGMSEILIRDIAADSRMGMSTQEKRLRCDIRDFLFTIVVRDLMIVYGRGSKCQESSASPSIVLEGDELGGDDICLLLTTMN